MNSLAKSDSARLVGQNQREETTPRKSKLVKALSGKMNLSMRACALLLMWAATAMVLSAQTFSVLHNFDRADGAVPEARLMQGPDGYLYGTTYGGGFDFGTVFKITLAGTLTTVYGFCTELDCADGTNPRAGLILATDGNLYGTTSTGGTGEFGTAFKINPSTGARTTVYNFCSLIGCPDGEFPNGLVQATNGNFYGTTINANNGGPGTIFELTPGGTLTTLHTFCVPTCPDGADPEVGLLQAGDGNLYGISLNGGNCNEGIMFKTTPAGVETPVYSFCYPQGAQPTGLVQAAGGEFFGTTQAFGANNEGTAFKITPSGTLTTLYNFCSQPSCSDGSGAVGGVIQATDGNFYGTTFTGGANNDGTVFKLTPAGTLTTLHSFVDTDGASPTVGLFQATNGTFYGVTSAGGANGDGTVFSLDVGLGPFVETVPTSGAVGGNVRILGTSLMGATSVTFNGIPATFTVASHSLIKATVPTGATTGSVQVTTPSGTLTSNVVFRVRP